MQPHILVTGLPGIGKSTLVKRIVTQLKASRIILNGFLTEDIKVVQDAKFEKGGVGVRLIDPELRTILAHKIYHQVGPSFFRLGEYTVYVKKFEKLTLPMLLSFQRGILVIEIGSLELCSKKFEEALPLVFNKEKVRVLAIVPHEGPPLVEKLKRNNNCKLITVTLQNRDQLFPEICDLLLNNKS